MPSAKAVYASGGPYIPSIDSPYGNHDSDYRFLGNNVTALRMRPGSMVRYWEAKPKDHEALRNSLDRSFAALPLGVFHRLENVLDHLVFEQYNPLLLGQARDDVVVFAHGRAVPPLPELQERAARALLTDFILQRLIPVGSVQAAIDADGNLCIARHRLLDMYFGRKVDETAIVGQSAAQTRVVVQPDFSIIVIGLNQCRLPS